MTDLNESSIPLYLNINSQEDNLYTEYEESRPCLYYIEGIMTEDGHVFTFSEEAEAVYQEGILFNDKYEDFMTELNQFIDRYNVEFEQSEGSEMIISTIYVLRKYLRIGWNDVYELLKDH